VKAGAAAAAAAMVGPRLLHASDPRRFLATPTEIFADDLALEALNAAKAAGAQYADARVGNYRRQTLNTREHQITGVTDSESYGIGVRTLVDSAWGFASTATMTKDAVARCAREAVRLSRAAKSTMRRPVELAPVAPAKGTWITPIGHDLVPLRRRKGRPAPIVSRRRVTTEIPHLLDSFVSLPRSNAQSTPSAHDEWRDVLRGRHGEGSCRSGTVGAGRDAGDVETDDRPSAARHHTGAS